jgi:hypothetical protein
MRYRVPDDCAGVTHAGSTLDRASDGTVEAAESAAAALAPHGIVPATGDPGTETKAVSVRSRRDERRILR